jgi:hypothetical protein
MCRSSAEPETPHDVPDDDLLAVCVEDRQALIVGSRERADGLFEGLV